MIDVSVIAEYLKSESGLLPQIWEHYKLYTSTTVVAELLATKKAADADFKQKIAGLIEKHFTLVDIDRKVAEKAADVMQELEITFANALIAASAITKEMPLVTYDLTTFDLVPDLKLVDI